MSFVFYPGRLAAVLDTPVAKRGMAAAAAKSSLLEIAKAYVSTPYPKGARNPGGAGNPPYMRSQQFRDTLRLDVIGDQLLFSSSAVGRGSHPYGQNLITGGSPFLGPYRMLPPEYYL